MISLGLESVTGVTYTDEFVAMVFRVLVVVLEILHLQVELKKLILNVAGRASVAILAGCAIYPRRRHDEGEWQPQLRLNSTFKALWTAAWFAADRVGRPHG